MQWLIKQGAQFTPELIQTKVIDYKIDHYPRSVAEMITQLPHIVHGDAFKAQMMRFIPASVQTNTLEKSKFYSFLEAELLALFKRILDTWK